MSYNAKVRKLNTTDFSVKDADGTVIYSGTNGQTAIQTALNGAGAIYIDNGLYDTTSVLTVPSNTEIKCGPNVHIKGRGDNGPLNGSGHAQAHPLIRNANNADAGNPVNSNITIIGGLWDGNVLDTAGTPVGQPGTTKSITANLDFLKCDNVTLFRVRSINSQSECIKVRESKNAFITNCYTKHSRLTSDDAIGKAGIHTGNVGSNVIVMGNVCEDSGGEGIGSYYDSGNVIIANNVSRYISYGRNHILQEGNASTNEQVEQTIIAHNKILAAWYGINIISCKHVTIQGNDISSAIPMNEAFTFEGTIRNQGIRIGGNSEGITVQGNNIHDCQMDGIQIANSINDCQITGNIIRNVSMRTANTYDGIVVELTDGTVTKSSNKIANNIINDKQTPSPRMRYGINFKLNNLSLSDVWCHGNQIYNPQGGATINVDWGGTSGRFLGDTRFYKNTGYNPFGRITNAFNNSHNEVGMPKASTTGFTYAAAPTANTEYTVVMSPIFISVVGGNHVAITIRDKPASAGGNIIMTINSALNVPIPLRLDIGWTINFGAFTLAPTVTVVGV